MSDRAYEAARSEAALIERPGRGLLRLTGPQRVWFLQNTITNDVESVAEGSWVESCFLTPKGKVVAHFRAGLLPDEVLLDVDPPGTSDLLDWFVRYRFRTKVEIEDLAMPCFTVVGPRAAELAPDGALTEDPLTFGGRLGPLPTADVRAAEPPAGFVHAPPELYEILRVEAGVGRFGADYGPHTLPQEAGLTSIVSVSKGCYVGQEVVARLHFRGHVNRTLRPLSFDGIDDPAGRGLEWEGRRVGAVTSAVRSPVRGIIGIGMLRVEVPEGGRLTVEGGGWAVAGALPEGTKVKAGPD